MSALRTATRAFSRSGIRAGTSLRMARPAAPFGRAYSMRAQHRAPRTQSSGAGAAALGALAVGAVAGWYLYSGVGAQDGSEWKKVNFNTVYKDIAGLLEDEDYDDGSYGPVFVRLAWHTSGTFDKADGSGGSDGGTIRFKPEANHGGNAGLEVARARLEPVKRRHPNISYADLYTLAGVVGVQELDGPTIPWRPGRVDKPSGAYCTPDGRLPDGAQGADHVRDVFYRMGFSDQEIVALIGAHALGRCHSNRSGFEGPWNASPTSFTNFYFTELLDNTWVPKKWAGPFQYVDKPTGAFMMLPADMAIRTDPRFRQYAEKYAKDQDAFFADFAAAFAKLLELGVTFPADAPVYRFKTLE